MISGYQCWSRRCLASTFALLLVAGMPQTRAAAPPSFEHFEWLPGIPTTTVFGNGPFPTRINDHGDLIGNFRQSTRFTGFTYIDDVFRNVPLSLSQNTRALGINNDGVVVGSHGSSSYIWYSPTSSPLLTGIDHSALIDINNAGVAVGTRDNVPFRYPGGDLSGGIGGNGIAINDAGEVAGFDLRGDPDTLWIDRAGVTETLTSLQATIFSSHASLELNAAGQIAGTLAASGASQSRAFRWSSGLEILDPLPGNIRSTATGIDDRGRVVGESRAVNALNTATMWIDGVGFALNDFAGAALDGGYLRNAGDISDNGVWLTGYGAYQGEQRAWRAQLAAAEVFVWTDAAGGNYADPDNWDIDATPAAGDDVLFDLPDSYTVTLDADGAARNATVRAGDVRMELGAFRWQLDELSVENGGIGSARLTIAGNEGDVVLAATAAPAAAIIEETPPAFVTGAITIGAIDELSLARVSTLVTGDISVSGVLDIGSLARVTTNAEIIVRDAGILRVAGELSTTALVDIAGGRAEIHGGVLGGNGTEIRIGSAPGGLGWGRLELRDGASGRAAHIDVGGDEFGPGATLDARAASITSTTLTVSGAMSLSDAAAATISDDVQIPTFGTLTVGEWSGEGGFGGTLDASAAMVTVGSSTADEFLNDEQLGRVQIGAGGQVNARELVVYGTIEVADGGTLNTETLDVYRTLVVRGETPGNEGEVQIRNGVRVLPGGVAAIAGHVTLDDAALLEIGDAAFNETDPANTARGQVAVRGSGVLDADEISVHGSLTAVGGGTIIMGELTNGPVTGAVNVGGGAVLSGTGTIFGNVLSGQASQPFSGSILPGSAAPPPQPALLTSNPSAATVLNTFGTLTVDGDVQAFGVLEIEIGGVDEHDVFVVTGTLTLGGELRLVFVNGYEPDPGDPFAFLMADGIIGGFDRVTTSGLAPGNVIALMRDANTFSVTVSGVPLPGAATFFFSALVAIGFRRRTRDPRWRTD